MLVGYRDRAYAVGSYVMIKTNEMTGGNTHALSGGDASVATTALRQQSDMTPHSIHAFICGRIVLFLFNIFVVGMPIFMN